MVQRSVPNRVVVSGSPVSLSRAQSAGIQSLIFWLSLTFSSAQIVAPLSSAEIQWSGAVNDRFPDPRNWVGGVVPGVRDTAIVARAAPPNHGLIIDAMIRLEGLQIGQAGADQGLHEVLTNHGDLELGKFTMQFGDGVLARYDQLGGQLGMDELVFDGRARGLATFQVQAAEVYLGPGGIRMAASSPDAVAEIRLLSFSILDARDAGSNVFPEIAGTLRLQIEEGSIMQVAGNVDDIRELSDQVELSLRKRPCEAQVHDLVFDYDPGSDSTYITSAPSDRLFPGDADMDSDFDQLDLVRVQIAAKYLTGKSATWGEGDWDGAPGGTPGNPPPGDGLFNQLDIVTALEVGIYASCPLNAVLPSESVSAQRVSNVNEAIAQPALLQKPRHGELTLSDWPLDADNLAEADLIYVPEPSAALLFGLAAAFVSFLPRETLWGRRRGSDDSELARLC